MTLMFYSWTDIIVEYNQDAIFTTLISLPLISQTITFLSVFRFT